VVFVRVVMVVLWVMCVFFLFVDEPLGLEYPSSDLKSRSARVRGLRIFAGRGSFHPATLEFMTLLA
jgi:hypothetical protein